METMADLTSTFASPEKLVKTFSQSCSQSSARAACNISVAAYNAVAHLGSAEEKASVRIALLNLLQAAEMQFDVAERSPRRRRRLKGPEESVYVPVAAAPCEPSASLWLPAALAAALPLLNGALPRDDKGMCVIPHPHKLERKRTRRFLVYLTAAGRVAYDTQRTCDNCDKPIQERTWFACSQGCEVDFCEKCHKQLQRKFAGRDVEHASWAAQFVARSATFVLKWVPPKERKNVARELAFNWPLNMFEKLMRSVTDVADAKVVHLEDGHGSNISAHADFWHVIGLLQLLRASNVLPAEELRFGESTARGPRIPQAAFVLKALDKCDAEAEWYRWKSRPSSQKSPEEIVLDADPFEVSEEFALFLAHGSLVPIGFRQRCLLEDVHETAFHNLDQRLNEVPKINIEVVRDPKAIFKKAVSTFGSPTANVSCLLSVTFAGEPGEGPGVIREFLRLALQSILESSHIGSLGDHDTQDSDSSTSSTTLWEYDDQLRTYWFSSQAPQWPEAFRACGVLLGHAVLTDSRLPAAFPRALYNQLLLAVGSAKASPPSLSDLASVHPHMAHGLQQLLDYKGDDVAEVFTLDWPRASELLNVSREQYVNSFIKWFFEEKFAAQLGPLTEGFRAVLGRSKLLPALVDAEQLEQIICGAEDPLDVEALRLSAELANWTPADSDYIETFWEVLRELSDVEQRRFIVFVSACGRMPPQGWQDFVLRIQKHGAGDDRLPTAYTCFTLLLLPRYSDKGLLKSRLRAAINETEGFGLS